MDEWITVQLKGYYFKPVIIAGPPTYHGTHAVVARIRNLRHGHDCPGWCFDVRLQEPPCMDQVHPNPEGMNWLVIESGAWVTDARTSRRSEWSSSSDRGEQTIQASVTEIEGDMRLTGEMFHRVNFLGNGFSRLPVVLSQVMTNYVSANSSLSALSKPKPRCTGGQLRQDASAARRLDPFPGDARGGWLSALEWRRRRPGPRNAGAHERRKSRLGRGRLRHGRYRHADVRSAPHQRRRHERPVRYSLRRAV